MADRLPKPGKFRVGALVAIADASLRITLADDSLADLLGAPARGARVQLSGCNLRELIPSPAADALERLSRGVGGEVVVTTLDDECCLVASLISVDDERWLMLRVRRQASVSSPVPTEFVGRAAELLAFENFLFGSDRSLLIVEGPLGIGKSTLLDAFETRCRRLGCPSFRLDARAVAPEDSAVLTALAPRGEAAHGISALFNLARRVGPRRWVLLIDNFDAWAQTGTDSFRKRFFGSLPDDCRVVVATRSRPNLTRWTDSTLVSGRRGSAEGGTRDSCNIRTHRLKLEPLDEADARLLATLLDIDVSAHARLLRRAKGHPLSIVTIAGARSSVDEGEYAREALTSDGAVLLRQDHLELVSLLPRITEDLLAQLLEDDAAATSTYVALSTICVRDPTGGLRMPDVIRRALTAGLRSRNPVRLASLRLRIAQYYAERLADRTASHVPSVVDDLFDAFEDHPPWQRVFGTSDCGVVVRRAQQDDLEDVERALRAQLAASGGVSVSEIIAEAATTAAYLAERDGVLVGVLQFTVLSGSDAGSPAVDQRRGAVHALLQRFDLDGDLRIAIANAFILGDDEDQERREIGQSLTRQHMHLILTLPDLGASVVISDPTVVPGLPGSEVVVADCQHMSVRDLRWSTPSSIVMGLVHSNAELWPTTLDPSPSNLEITTDDVRFALAHVDQPAILATSPITLGRSTSSKASQVLTGPQLRALLVEAIESLAEDGNKRQYDILRAIYIDRRGKHELIASELGLPYSTFRRHLTRGIERVRNVLISRVRNRAAAPSE